MVNKMIEKIKDFIEIDKKEVLRYLKYKNQNIDDNLSKMIEESILETKKIINPRFIYRKYLIKKLKYNDEKNELMLEDGNIVFKSNDLYKLLENCNECMLISATLGLEIERELRKLTYTNLTKGVILDACATTAIEEVCDIVQDNISRDLQKINKYITSRYSPGYGDLSIEYNVQINNILNSHNKLGLTVNHSGIMIPRKSVIAIIGVSDKKTKSTKKTCENCDNVKNCEYKKEGHICEI